MTKLAEEGRERAEVLIVEDDEAIRRHVGDQLRTSGFTTTECDNGAGAIARIDSDPPDAVVLDLGLPDLSGLEVLRHLRDHGDIPVVILSGHATESDRILGLEMGAHDYVVKPFSARELAIRVRKQLERRPAVGDDDVDISEGSIAGVLYTVDHNARRLVLGGEEVALRPREFALLAHFVTNPRQVLTKTQLLQAVWDAEHGWVGESTVTEHVRRLRAKLRVDGSDASPIDTLWGVGYRFEPVC